MLEQMKVTTHLSTSVQSIRNDNLGENAMLRTQPKCSYDLTGSHGLL